MKNTINYYYNLNPNKINHIFDYYYFYINQELYYFLIYDRDIKNINDIYQFNKEMVNRGIMVNEIIDNRNNTIVTYVNDIPYILVRVFININKSINIPEINYLANIRISYGEGLMRGNWGLLWKKKIDYLEYHLEQNYKKYPILSDSFNYFVGMAENAISYLDYVVNNYNPLLVDIGVISHDRLDYNDTIYSLYDPMNIIIDHKARDIAEYIKLSFFRDNYSIFDELDIYFRYNYYSIYGIGLIIARVMYPSFYFMVYEEVINNKANERDVVLITSRLSDYEDYLGDVFQYFHKYYNIKDINWIKKRGF